MKKYNQFTRSEIGAQAAWKGFSSQTLYIASRIVNDTAGKFFCPEDIEDLVIKFEDKVVEAVQIKNVSAELTLSHLSSSKSSLSGEGFFRRVCSLHAHYPEFNIVKVVYFTSLGDELNGVSKGIKSNCISVKDKLINKHNLTMNEAEWLINSLLFEKVDISTLEQNILTQLEGFVETMAAPALAKSLLIQYVSELSKLKGFISNKSWKEKIHEIGVDIASIDGYYKEYSKSLIRLSELTTSKKEDQLRIEFSQGISTHPDHIRYNTDFRRDYWLNVISSSVNESNVVIIKGVSGQGKTAICYRYLLENYPEEFVFCVRHISSEKQAENLVVALRGIAKHTHDLIVYIDVIPGETKWGSLIQEMSMRNISIPILVSIRDEDFNLTPLNSSMFTYKLIDVQLTEEEAKLIYNDNTILKPHAKHRTFEESWISFGGKGPLIEYTYFLTNNQTLTERLRGQISNLLLEKIPDSWLRILRVVSRFGKIGCSVSTIKLKSIINCDDFYSAIQRFKDEYLIKDSLNNTHIEALHPIRATILDEVLKLLYISEPANDLMDCIRCIDGQNLHYLLMDYFTEHTYEKQVVKDIAVAVQNDWSSFAGAIRAMLWLDIKRYYERNARIITNLIDNKGKAWLTMIPIDISGLLRPGEFVLEYLAESMSSSMIDRELIIRTIDDLRASLSSICIDYEAVDTLISFCTIPLTNLENDDDCDALGYSLFWLAKRGLLLSNIELTEDSWKVLLQSDHQICANTVRGMFEHELLTDDYVNLKSKLLDRFLADFHTIIYSESDEDIVCRFVPPVFDDTNSTSSSNNFNHYWRIKALNILKNIFPSKEYIEVELLGIDLLSDLAINPIDYKVRISKSNRHDAWITEINSWFISRIEFFCRPLSWNEYISKIEKIRLTSNKLISDSILLLEHLYEKKNLKKELYDNVHLGIVALSSLNNKDLLLPVSVVDRYCLYRENMQNENYTKSNNILVSPLLYSKYKILRQELSNTYSSVEFFFRNFEELLLRRVENTSLEGINLNLGLFNLFESLKSISRFQQEFDLFFVDYCSLKNSFKELEIENLNVLLNIWHYVIENPPRGYRIAYDAKLKYRKAVKLIHNMHMMTLKKEISILTMGKKVYFLKNLDASNCDLESECNCIAQIIRKQLLNCVSQFSTEKWLIDSTGYEFVYIPLYEETPFAVGFSIPSLYLFNEKHFNSLYPIEIEESIYEVLGLNYSNIEKSILLISTFGTIQMLIHQYNAIINLSIEADDLCLNGLRNYVQSFYNKIVKHFSNLIPQIEILNMVRNTNDKNILGCVSSVLECIENLNYLSDLVNEFKPIEEFEELVKNACEALTILHPYIANVKQTI